MSLLAMNSLYRKRAMTGTYGPPEEKHSRRVLRGQQFSKRKIKIFNSLFLSVYLVFLNTFDFYCRFICRALFVGRM